MKFVALFVLLVLLGAAAAAVLAQDMPVNDPIIIKRVNSHPKAKWKAGESKAFRGKTISQIKGLLGTHLIDPDLNALRPRFSHRPGVDFVTMNSFPESYDLRKERPACVHSIKDQGRCGSCWAESASTVLADRYCVALGGKEAFPDLSAQDMVSCDTGDYGCQGGILDNAWRYLEETGITTDKCLPYVSGDGRVPKCDKDNKCFDRKETFKKFRAKRGSTMHFDSVEAIMQSIMEHGSVQAGFKVYHDLMSYKFGIYHHISGGFLGGHAVRVVGWGRENDTDYWIIANSWTDTWGESGYFRMKKGTNECDIEANMYAGEADV